MFRTRCRKSQYMLYRSDVCSQIRNVRSRKRR
jgi:hypothetical protein